MIKRREGMDAARVKEVRTQETVNTVADRTGGGQVGGGRATRGRVDNRGG